MKAQAELGGTSYLLVEYDQSSDYDGYFPCCEQERGEPEASFETDREKETSLEQK